MRFSNLRCAVLLGLLLTAITVTAGAQTAAPDTAPVPKGEVLHLTFEKSRIFPGTFRDYWIYIPAQYTPDKPACVYVNQDGIQWRAPEVFDQLIAHKEMPVTIGVFVMHGRVKADDPKAALDRFNRSLEYDGLGDSYARFLLEELLPEVEKQKASDGRALHLSHDANDRAIGGSSSGAVCAFTAAWERPDAFHRVFSCIGTYVGLRGADRYPTLIRKTEPKPLRVFLQDGSHDLNIYGGDWWMANQMMERALTFAGYEVNHVWGEGGHSGDQGTQLFPEAMRWLWKDWPAPVKAAAPGGNAMLNAIVLPGEGWQKEQDAGSVVNTLTVDTTGNVTAKQGRNGANGGPIVVSNGSQYTASNNSKDGVLRLVRPGGRKVSLDAGGLHGASGLTLSPDQTLLYATETGSHWVWSYQIQADGTLKHGQRYYWLHSPDDADDAGAGSMTVDKEGRLYVATRLGIQVCDQAGRVNVILPLPNAEAANAVAFGGPKFDTLYAASDKTVYRRKTLAVGAPAFASPLRPSPPGL